VETIQRSIVKSVTWRIFSFAAITTIALVVTGSITMALSMGVAEAVVKSLMYFMHERWWAKTEWGIKVEVKKDEDIQDKT